MSTLRGGLPRSCSRGQGVAEYIIIVIVIAVAIIVGIRYFAGGLGSQFQNATKSLDGIQDSETDEHWQGPERHRSGQQRLSREQGLGPQAERRASRKRSQSGPADSSTKGRESRDKGSGSESLDDRVEALGTGVGESDFNPAQNIKLNWWTIGIIAFVVCCIGIYVVLRFGGEKPKQGKKKLKQKQPGPKTLANENGQVLVLGLIVLLGMTMAAIAVANVGMMVAEKIHLQDTVDAAAYSAAVTEARYMNLSAYINRAMLANYDSMAFNTALWATVDADDHGLAVVVDMMYKLSELLLLSVIGSPLSKPVDAFADVLRAIHDVLHGINKKLYEFFSQDEGDYNQYLEKYNTHVLTMYQGILYAAMQSSRHMVVQEVAHRMDPEVTTKTLVGLGAEAISYSELERAVDFVVEDTDARGFPFQQLNDAFNSLSGVDTEQDDHERLLAAVTESSLNKFSAGRERTGQADLLRQFNTQNMLDRAGLADWFERAFEIACLPACQATCWEDCWRMSCVRRCLGGCPDWCETEISLKIGAAMRDFQENTASDEHLPFITRQRLREVNFMGIWFEIDSNWSTVNRLVDGLESFGFDLHRIQGYTSGNKMTDVANVANAMLGFGGAEDFERALECRDSGTGCEIGVGFPKGGLNALNVLAANTMLPPLPPLVVDPHWDGIGDAKPTNSHEIWPNPAEGKAAAVEYEGEVEVGANLYEGVPNYDFGVDIDDMGFSHYHYLTDERYSSATPVTRMAGISRGDTRHSLEGPSIAVIGVKRPEDINGLRGLGIGLEPPNDYPMSAISRAQVYYLKNPYRPNEVPSLFNPHWVARLAPIDSPDAQPLLRQGLPFLASRGIPISPTR